MDSDKGPPPKRCKSILASPDQQASSSTDAIRATFDGVYASLSISNGPLLLQIPEELRRLIYKQTVLPDGTKSETRILTKMTTEGIGSTEQQNKKFNVINVQPDGPIPIFHNELVNVQEFTEDVLSLVLSDTLFTFNSRDSLETFGPAAEVYIYGYKITPALHVEVNFMQNMHQIEQEDMGLWEKCVSNHGRLEFFRYEVKEWLKAIQCLPMNATIHLVFPYIWRDFRELRGLSDEFGLSKRKVTFQFPTPSNGNELPHFEFFVAHTIAAVQDIWIPPQVDVPQETKLEFLNYGCRGCFHPRRRPDTE